MRTSISAVGDVAPDAAWERYADLDRWPEWAPQITGVEAAGRRLAPGLEGVVRAAGVVRVGFRVLAVDEVARTWSWRVRLGPVTLHLEHGVDPAGDAGPPGRPGTRTWLVMTGPAPLVAPYTPLALVALHSLVLDR